MNPVLSAQLKSILPPGRVVDAPTEVERLSKDFFWYSPVLKRQLEGKRGDVAVQPKTLAELKETLRYAYAKQVPVTVRGAGTGNYGQCIPLEGGIVLDLGGMDRILAITAHGTVICEPGARLGAIETAARKEGWELRCYPSTYQKASMGGFLAGGSGGIGSIRHGLLRDNQTVRQIKLLTMEAEPREITLTGQDIFKSLHAWGTTGVMIELEVALAAKENWAQLAISFDSFDPCFNFTEAVARNDEFIKRLVTAFEWPIPKWFAPLQKWVPPERALVFFEVADAQLESLTREAVSAGGRTEFSSPHQEPRRGAQLSDYTWNHTTLWALKGDPTVTYLQCGFDRDRVRDQMSLIKEKYGGDFLFHIEFARSGGVVGPGSIPIIRFTTEERLQEMIDYCGEIGVGVANPHVNFLEGSGRWRPDDAKLIGKTEFDPLGLLNPGKIKTFNPPSPAVTHAS